MRAIQGFRGYEFEDDDGDSVQLFRRGDGVLEVRCYADPINLTREHARALLPLLQHFAETGELPEPKP